MSDPNEIPLPHRGKLYKPLSGEREVERLSVGKFFDEHKRVIDGRRADLARVGMMERHVEALRMPDLADKPLQMGGGEIPQANVAGPIHLAVPKTEDAEELPTLSEYKPKRLPAHLEEAL